MPASKEASNEKPFNPPPSKLSQVLAMRYKGPPSRTLDSKRYVLFLLANSWGEDLKRGEVLSWFLADRDL